MTEEQRRVEVVRVALLSSYNMKRPLLQCIDNETAGPIWVARAENVLRELEKVGTMPWADAKTRELVP